MFQKMFQVFNKLCGKKKSNSCKLEVNDMNKFFATIGPTFQKNSWSLNKMIKFHETLILLFSFPLMLMKGRRLLRT